ncbi:ABC transporter ATP-binding protein [Pontiellaceae bacterium B1224]|nr:ABC transporter ATP-binding protein [Pontiellaceae bacterium B1224]
MSVEEIEITNSGIPLCEVTDVYKLFGKATVLNGVSMEIQPGERVALMGPSGSGKSTLLNCISGIERPDAGQIRIGQVDLATASATEMAALRRNEVSTVFQFFHLLPTLTAFENIELSLQLTGIKKADRQERVKELLEAVQLSSHKTAYPETLSGGERQRIAIARALAHRPRLLLADEPTGSLDTKAGNAILDLLEKLTEQFRISMLLVTHSNDATRICQRTIHMRDGKIG